MKKTIQSIFLFSFLSIPAFVHAQGVGFGVKAGVNFANQSVTNITTKSMTGFQGGAYLVFEFSESWGLQPEVLISSQGSKMPDVDELNEFIYISMPVLLRWKPFTLLSIETGPQFSFLIDARSAGVSIKDEIKKSDFGFAVGTTLHLPIGFNGGLRYVWGFTNVSDLGNSLEIKNRMLQVYVGWTIFESKN